MPHITNQQINSDIRTRGKILRPLLRQMNAKTFRRSNWFMDHFMKGHFPKDLNVQTVWVPRPDGSELRVLVVRPHNQGPLATGVLWLHGGGYAIGIPEMDFGYVRKILAVSNSVIVLPDYRRSTEAPYPAALDDAYLALRWMKGHNRSLGINPLQLFTAGESAGGGLTAALSLYARDRGEVKIAFQMPLFPMLDDRLTPSSTNNDAPVWDSTSNKNAWQLYLEDQYQTDAVAPYAAPARATNYQGLPPTYTFVGTIEPFYQETLTYIKNLRNAGVTAHVDIYQGAFHNFDALTGNSNLAKRASATWQDAFQYASEHDYSRFDAES